LPVACGGRLKISIWIFPELGSDFSQKVPQIDTFSFVRIAPADRAAPHPTTRRLITVQNPQNFQKII